MQCIRFNCNMICTGAAGEKIMFRSTILLLSVAMVLLALGPMTLAGEYHYHDAHEHGVAYLNVAIEGNNLYIEFSSPAANIVGFEHPPRTQSQKDAVKTAKQRLKEGDKLFILSPESRSRLLMSRVETDIDHKADHKTKSEHDHEQNEPHRGDEPSDKEPRNAVKHAQEHHSEFEATYQFVLKDPNRLSRIDVNLFKAFPGIEHIELQLVTEKRQTAQELTPTNYAIGIH